jgi:membrane protein DedA with SNARE-associated domain
MGVIIYIGAYFGKWLDLKFETNSSTYALICTIIALVFSFWSLLKTVNRLNEIE